MIFGHKNTRARLCHQHNNEPMKSWVSSVLVLLAICMLPAHCVLADEKMNEYPTVHNRKLLQSRPCIIRRLVDYQMLAEDGEDLWACELQGEDCALAGFEVDSKITVELVGIDSSTLEANHVISGVTTLYIPGATIMNGLLYIPPGSNIVFGELLENRNNKGGRELKTTADLASGGVSRTVLAVRIVASDAATTSSATEISDKIFGTDGDIVNLKTRFAACSYGEITIDPFIGISASGYEISNGVVEVTIPNNATDTRRTTIGNAALSALKTLVGEIYFQFDHIMLCLPPGTTRGGGGWQAYTAAGISSITSYNDVWCNLPSAQMHEIAHNFGLAHSNDGIENNGDKSCIMGYSYNEDEGPLMCFNPAKSWQLGWYGPRRAMIGFDSTNLWVGKLVGIADYDPDAVDKTVLLQLENGAIDYYIGFNRKTGINRGTKEAQDLVEIVTQGSGYSPSDLVARLGVGDEYQMINVNNSSESLIVRVNRIVEAGNPWYADVEVYNPATGQASSANSSETDVPPTTPSSPPSPAPSTSASSPAPSFQASPAPSTIDPSSAPSLHPSVTPSTSASSQFPSLHPSTAPSTSSPSTLLQLNSAPSPANGSIQPSSVPTASIPTTASQLQSASLRTTTPPKLLLPLSALLLTCLFL